MDGYCNLITEKNVMGLDPPLLKFQHATVEGEK